MASLFAILYDDAAGTVGRIRGDVRHLRELGQRAKIGAKIAKAKIERALDHAADEFLRTGLRWTAGVGGRK